MSDLIERLRDYGDRMDYEVHHDRIEAADRIEALTADNERLREALEEVWDLIDTWTPEFIWDDEWPATEAKARAALAGKAEQ